MSKYNALWEYVQESGTPALKLSFAEIHSILGFEIDHAFLSFKKELTQYGYKVGKISLKEQTAEFLKLDDKA